MPEQSEVTLEWWTVITDKGEYRLTEKEMEILMEADKRGARFVMFDEVALNIAFVKEAVKHTERRNPKFYSIKGEEKYLTENRKELSGHN